MKASICIAAFVLAAGASRTKACDTCGRCTAPPVVAAVELDDSTRIARMLTGTIEPSLPRSEEFYAEVRSVWDLRNGSVVPSRYHAWAHDIRFTRVEGREGRMQYYRIERAAVVWSEAWRSRLE